jgi:hypothetical protein
MASTTQRNGSIEAEAPSTLGETGEVPVENAARDGETDVAHTKSILNAANTRAVIWTIGSKRNANSTME